MAFAALVDVATVVSLAGDDGHAEGAYDEGAGIPAQGLSALDVDVSVDMVPCANVGRDALIGPALPPVGRFVGALFVICICSRMGLRITPMGLLRTFWGRSNIHRGTPFGRRNPCLAASSEKLLQFRWKRS